MYDDVRAAESPEAELLTFLQSTYETAADLAHWTANLSKGATDTMTQCTHLDGIRVTETDVHVCPECVKMGDRWVHLRLCLSCGQVGCCDSSKNKHATKHFHKTAIR